MVTQRGICNRCNEEIKGERDGYSVSATPGSFLTLDIVKGINPNWEEHYCGKECLMLVLNEKADGLPAGQPASLTTCLPAGRADKPSSTETERPDDAEEVVWEVVCEEEHYEDHVAA